jgi:hypothetical protein
VVQEEGWESSRSDSASREGRLAVRPSMVTRRGSGHRRIAHGPRAPALFIGRRVEGGSRKSSHGMGTSGCGDVRAVGSQWRTTGGEGRRGAACGRVAPASGPTSVIHRSTSARRMDRRSPACFAVRVRRRTAVTNVERWATSSVCACSRTETIPFSLV